MTDIKPGSVCFIQVSNEPVFVLDIFEGNNFQKKYPALSGFIATVRRPIEGENGITHAVEMFHVEELESLMASKMRQVKQMEELQEAFDQHRGRKTSVSSDVSLPN